MEESTNEDQEIQRMRQLLKAMEFDDTSVADGTIKHAVLEECLFRRNNKYEKMQRPLWKKWIKGLRLR